MEIKNILISFLVFSVVIVVGTLIMADFNNTYSGTDVKSFNTTGYNGLTFNTLDVSNETQTNVVSKMENNTMGGSVSSSLAGAGMFSGAYQSFKLLRNTFGYFQTLTSKIAKAFEIPDIFVTVAYTAFAIIIILAVIALIMGRTSV